LACQPSAKGAFLFLKGASMQFYDLHIFVDKAEVDNSTMAIYLEQTFDRENYNSVTFSFDQAEIVAQEILRLVKENKEKKEV
jgi:hypothetical protein